jgi:hypothetical protein
MALTTEGTVLDKQFYGEKTTIISKSGYGKTYAARVIIEEAKALNIPIIVIDPQGGYDNLDHFAYVDAAKTNMTVIGKLAAKHGGQLVIRLKKLDIPSQERCVQDFLTSYRKHVTKGIQTIIIDEAHKFAPEQDNPDVKNVVRAMFQENRSDGLGCIAITQRPARVDKTVLSQSDNLLLGRVNSHADKQAIGNYLDDKSEVDKLAELDKGEFWIYGFGKEQPALEHVREASTKHSGMSPQEIKVTDKDKLFKEARGASRGGITMAETTVAKVIPTFDTFGDLAVMGMKFGLGMAAGGIAGSYIGKVIPTSITGKIPVVSARTIGSAATTVGVFAGYKLVPDVWWAKDILKYGAAGSAAFTVGSLAFDIMGALNVQLPFVNSVVSAATNVAPATNKASPDLNTAFA